jgi:S-DNA-T family DNA segregation ATPase FtsK/SpoIIIE
MSRKDGGGSHHGWADFIGVGLLAAAVLLLLAQFSFHRGDIAGLVNPPNDPLHNWIGWAGAHIAWLVFGVFGVTAYLVPVLFAAFGVGYLFNFLGYLREHSRWSVFWAAMLLVSLTGLLHIMEVTGLTGELRVKLGANSAGGLLGFLTFEYALWMAGKAGAVIVYATVALIGILYLTNFRLGAWLQAWFDGQVTPFSKAGEKATGANPAEAALERKARELEKRKRELEAEVARAAAASAKAEPGRDLSVPQPAKPGRSKKSAPEPVVEIEPAEEVEIISASEVKAAATTGDVLGAKADAAKPAKDELAEPEPSAAATDDDKPGEPKPEPQINVIGLTPTRPKPKPRKPITVAATPMIGNYQLPSLDFLQLPDLTVKPTESKEELLANARLMQQTLAQFDIPVELGDITKGPTITRYELHPAPGVKLEKIQNLNNNLAAALRAERIHILAPVPGKSSVGVEVPNSIKTKVIMRDLFETDEWRATKAKIPIALGKDVYGHPIIADLAEMPHLLIAGSTGSGKSVCINSIIASLLYRFTPDQLRFVMIDPKVVELQQYNVLPHLVVPVVTDPKKVILALRWVVNEMEKRYQIFARVGVRNIATFNARPKHKPLPEREPELPLMAKKEKVEPGADGFAVEVDEEIVVPREDDIVIPEKLSYIVVIIDELADLMLVAPADVEMAIARITQMARAAGIHCIVATQRPSVDVITGVIKANIPARIAFQVASRVDSRTILDAMGADKLLGKGDMLYLPPGSAKLIRAQGALITDQEINSAVDFIAKQAKPSYEMEIHQQLSKPTAAASESGIDEDEEIIQDCIEVIRSEQKASVSLLQRRLRLGYGRAARIMDELENRGIVGPSNGAEPRDILLDLDVEQPPADAPK